MTKDEIVETLTEALLKANEPKDGMFNEEQLDHRRTELRPTYRNFAKDTLDAISAKGLCVVSEVDLQKLRFAAGFDDRAPDLAGVAGKGFPLVEMLTTDPRDFSPPTPEHKEG